MKHASDCPSVDHCFIILKRYYHFCVLIIPTEINKAFVGLQLNTQISHGGTTTHYKQSEYNFVSKIISQFSSKKLSNSVHLCHNMTVKVKVKSTFRIYGHKIGIRNRDACYVIGLQLQRMDNSKQVNLKSRTENWQNVSSDDVDW